MKGEDCVIYPKHEMKILFEFLVGRIEDQMKFYTDLQKKGMLEFYNQVRDDLRERDE